MTKKIIAASALAFLLSTGAAFAQTSTYTSTGTTGTTGTTSTVGVPNTGAGGYAVENIALMGVSAVVALGAGFALLRRGFT